MNNGLPWRLKLLGKIIRWIDRMRDRFPKEDIRRKLVYISLITTLLPLFLIVITIQGTFSILYLIFSFRDDVSAVIHISFLLIYMGVGMFTLVEIREWWKLLDMIYEPIKTLEERTVETILDPFRSYLMKMDLIIAGIMLSVFSLVIVSIMLIGFYWLFLIPMILVTFIGIILIAISVLIYLLIKGMILFFIGFIWKKIDDRFKIIEKFKGNWDKIKALEDQMDHIDV